MCHVVLELCKLRRTTQGIYRKNEVKYPIKLIKRAKNNRICLHNAEKMAKIQIKSYKQVYIMKNAGYRRSKNLYIPNL